VGVNPPTKLTLIIGYIKWEQKVSYYTE
jgi:hypothetical protein